MSHKIPIIDRKIKIAVVGCGRISKNHFDSIKSHSNNLELVAVCDTDEKVLSSYAKKYNVAGFNDFNKMLNTLDLDIVALCTPSGLHPEQSILAAKKKVNIVTEKPMSTTWQKGLEMVKKSDLAEVFLFVVKQNRFNSTLQLLKRAIDEKRFGKIHLVQVNVFWTRPQSYYNQGNGWRGTKDLDGGAFMNQASHYVDLLDWLIGPVEKIQSIMSTYREIEVEDTGVLNIKWIDGTLGSMSVTMLTYPENLEGSITIIGEKGTVKLGGVAVNEIQLWNFAETMDYDSEVKKANYDTKSIYGFGHKMYYKNVIDVIRGKDKPETDGHEGLKSLELLVASYIAAKESKTIYLPLKPDDKF
jgi:UDP-N-acetyl-2-amino-2-deoxyglucuronate dehydrogenase